jgi:tRNA (guanosine-2'-O-)-methyltransferase
MELKKIINYFGSLVTEQRIAQFNKVIENRTRHITVALEDIYQPHNASAVLRTADCFGIQDVHVIENKNKYDVNPDVALGSYKWINLIRYNELENNTISSIKKLKNRGYRIVATTPHTKGVNLEDFDLSKEKIALFFGTELLGLSNLMLENADEFLKIPMYGFTESFNISVSASIILHHLANKLHNSNINWHLNEQEKDIILLKWLLTSVKRSDVILKNYCNTNDINLEKIFELL